MDVLPVQASAVSSERAFSSSKLTCTRERSKLSPENIEYLQIEIARGDVNNFVCVVMEHENLGVEEAIEYVDGRIRERVDEYVALKKDLPAFVPGLDEQVASYIRGIGYFVQGFIEWSFITPRYFGDDAKKVKETGIVHLVEPIALDTPVRFES